MIYAGFWRRFAASFIDSIVLNMLLSPLMGLMMFNTVQFSADAMAGMSDAEIFATFMPMIVMAIAASFVGFVVQIVYFAYMESSKYQATLGKMALGIIVTDTDGNPISFGRSAGRNLGKILSGFILMIGYIMAAFTSRKQALHDLMAGTLVIKKVAGPVNAYANSTTASSRVDSEEYTTDRYDNRNND